MNWDQRFIGGFTYGTAPNEFLVGITDKIPKGRILSLAEGEGRNAVYLASLGYDVTAVDASAVALRRAVKLAEERNVRISVELADLAHFDISTGEWDGILSCYCHLPSAIRIPLHSSIVRGLKRGGAFILEGFSKEQLAYDTGGPKDPDMLLSLDELRLELDGLDFIHAVQMERDVREGNGHTGVASVVQIVGIKPGRFSASTGISPGR